MKEIFYRFCSVYSNYQVVVIIWIYYFCSWLRLTERKQYEAGEKRYQQICFSPWLAFIISEQFSHTAFNSTSWIQIEASNEIDRTVCFLLFFFLPPLIVRKCMPDHEYIVTELVSQNSYYWIVRLILTSCQLLIYLFRINAMFIFCGRLIVVGCWLFGFYGISNFVGYLTPSLFLLK